MGTLATKHIGKAAAKKKIGAANRRPFKNICPQWVTQF